LNIPGDTIFLNNIVFQTQIFHIFQRNLNSDFSSLESLKIPDWEAVWRGWSLPCFWYYYLIRFETISS